MDSAARLLRRHFGWVRALSRSARVAKHERTRALILAGSYVIVLSLLIVALLDYTLSWIAAMFMQVLFVVFAATHVFALVEYQDRTSNASEAEHLYNPIAEVAVPLRVVQIIHLVSVGAHYSVLLIVAPQIAFDAYRSRHGWLLIDATTLWKVVQQFDLEAKGRLGYQAVAFVAVLINMIISLIIYAVS